MPQKVDPPSCDNRQNRQNALVPNLTESSKRTVAVLACVLKQLCSRNDQLILDPDSVTKFHALRPPAISVLDYLERIRKYAACSEECFILALVYIDRIIQSNHNFTVNSLNVHRLLITSVMLAAKFFDDQYFNNAYYAKIGGVPCSEINSLEVEFLFMINFSLFVTTEAYEQYYSELQNHALNSGCSCQVDAGPPLSPSPTMCYSSSSDQLQYKNDIPTRATTPRRLITRSQKRLAH